MAPPSQLAVATSAVNRLVKEERSYHRELEQQQARVENLVGKDEDENAEFTMRQERKAIEETRAVFPPLREKIKDAVEKLELQLETAEEQGSDSNAEEITKAKDAIAAAKQGYREIA